MNTKSSVSNNTGFIHRIRDKLRYNLLLQVIRNRLAAIGLEFTLYYLFNEELNLSEIPVIKGNVADYKLEFLKTEDMKIIGANARGYTKEIFLSNLKKGNKCFALKHKDEIVSFVWFDFNECNFKPKKFKLKGNEVYSHSLYTMEHYRGRNLAPYLKYQSYKILRKMGKDTCYSIIECYNFSSIKYMKKLNARKLKLALSIALFKKFYMNLTFKTYK
jgi:hypothetical protein